MHEMYGQGQANRPVALITGGSRGIGAAAALSLSDRGYDVAIVYRNKSARANEVVAEVTQRGGRGLAVSCDITQQEDIERLFTVFGEWSGAGIASARLDTLVLNASGGMERDLLATDQHYPMRINRDAQLALLEGALPLMRPGAVVVFVTSHWAHLYGKTEQLPVYATVAETKHAGELALRARQDELAQRGIRLVVVTGDLVEGTAMARLLERKIPGLASGRRSIIGELPTAAEMGEAIAIAATDTTMPGGHTLIVGGALETFLGQDIAGRPQGSPLHVDM